VQERVCVAEVPFLALDLVLSHGHESSTSSFSSLFFPVTISWPSCFDFLLGSAALHWLFVHDATPVLVSGLFVAFFVSIGSVFF
jgi:hypothetical protein